MSIINPPDTLIYSIGGGDGIATDDRHRMRVANFAALNRLLDTRMISVKTPIEADLQLYAGLIDRRQRLVDLRQIKGNRLFAEDLLARARRLDDEATMRIGRRADDDRVYIAADQFRRVGSKIGDAIVGRR